VSAGCAAAVMSSACALRSWSDFGRSISAAMPSRISRLWSRSASRVIDLPAGNVRAKSSQSATIESMFALMNWLSFMR
jgi:hypothetical protein